MSTAARAGGGRGAAALDLDGLAAALAGPVVPVWLVSGDEPLLVEEACDAIRARARADGAVERRVFFVTPGFDWGLVLADLLTPSLFGDRLRYEFRLDPRLDTRKAPQVDADTAAALGAIARDPRIEHSVLVICWGRLKADAGWVRDIAERGRRVEVWPLRAEQLPRWIVERARRLDVVLDDGAARTLADLVEGNLFAAVQELQRLPLLRPGARWGAEDIAAAVLDSSRHDAFALADAAFAGDPVRALRVLATIRAQDEEPLAVVAALAWQVRRMIEVGFAVRDGARDGDLRRFGLFGKRAGDAVRACRRLGLDRLEAALADLATIDASVKGGPGEPWQLLATLVARLAGASGL